MGPHSRRRFLASTGGVGIIALAGCIGSDDTIDDLPPPTIGTTDAPAIRVFADFSCSHCRSFKESVFPLLESELVHAEGIARLEHRDFSFLPSPWSDAVANGARAVQHHAGDASFFAFSRDIFGHQGDYSYDAIETVADTVADLGTEARAAAEAGTYQPVIDADYDYGLEIGVGGTPSIAIEDDLVNVNLSRPPAEIVNHLRSVLEVVVN